VHPTAGTSTRSSHMAGARLLKRALPTKESDHINTNIRSSLKVPVRRRGIVHAGGSVWADIYSSTSSTSAQPSLPTHPLASIQKSPLHSFPTNGWRLRLPHVLSCFLACNLPYCHPYYSEELEPAISSYEIQLEMLIGLCTPVHTAN
jgi:hypothetical protein